MKLRSALIAGAALLAPMTAWAQAAGGDIFKFEPAANAALDRPGALANAWGDYDGDGDLDLVTGFKDGTVLLLENDKGVLTPVDRGLTLNGKDARGLAWGDYDGDGDLDLYVGVSATPRERNRLFRNDGPKGFVEVGEALGVSPPDASTRQVTWIDIDLDGDLDLFVAQRAAPNQLFINEGGRFTEAAAQWGLADPRKSVGACFFDADQDGDLDLFVANQAGDRDGFFRNVGGRYEDVAVELGVTPLQRPADEGSVGCTVADYDNDGDFDLFVAAYGVNRLYRNDGGRFVEVAQSLGVVGDEHHVAGAFADIDQDGWLDLYVTTFRTPNPNLPDKLYRNVGGRFVEALPANLNRAPADHGVQWADFDGDGDLDLALTHNDDKVGGGRLFKNVSPPPAQRNALLVEALDPTGKRVVPGAEVRAYDAKGKLLGARLMDTGGGYDSQSAQPVHIPTLSAGKVRLEATFLTPQGRRTVTLDKVDPKRWRGKVVKLRQPSN